MSFLSDHVRTGRGIRFCIMLGVLILACLIACQSKSGSRSGAAEPIVDSVLTGDSTSIYYTTAGAGDTALVFIHCWSCDRSYWDEQLTALAPDYRVVAIDLAGHGESHSNRTDWLMSSYGADVAAVVEKLDLKPVILVGHSMGGAVAIEAARLMPDRVTALIGVDTYQDLVGRMPEDQLEQFLTPFKQNFPAAMARFIPSLFPPGADSALIAKVTQDMAQAPMVIAVPSIRNLLRYNGAAALTKMRKPIRAINADLFPTMVAANRRSAASFDVKYLPGTGHFLFLEKPAEFETLLRETIAEFWPRETSATESN